MKEKIKEIMKECFEIKNISDDISQNNTLKWDSLNHLNLISELEMKFDISFEPDEIMNMISLDNIVATMSSKGVQ